jgi:predicted RNA-binding Zn-ribbon protein involved in translation (DUF1610 family)
MENDISKQMMKLSKEELKKSIVAIILLIMARIIIKNLPMIDNIYSPFNFEIPEIILAGILVLISVIIFKFGIKLKNEIFANIKIDVHIKIIYYITSAIATLILYYGLGKIIPYYLEKIGLKWGKDLYEYVFLALFLLIISMLIYTIYNDFNDLNLSFSPKTKIITKNQIAKENSIICNNCGEKLDKGTKFCINCGEELIIGKSDTDVLEVKESTKSCSNCGEELYKGTKFCINCGEKVIIDKSDTDGLEVKENTKSCKNCGKEVIIDESNTDVLEVKENIKSCKNCGKELDEEAKFCINCGEKI